MSVPSFRSHAIAVLRQFQTSPLLRRRTLGALLLPKHFCGRGRRRGIGTAWGAVREDNSPGLRTVCRGLVQGCRVSIRVHRFQRALSSALSVNGSPAFAVRCGSMFHFLSATRTRSNSTLPPCHSRRPTTIHRYATRATSQSNPRLTARVRRLWRLQKSPGSRCGDFCKGPQHPALCRGFPPHRVRHL